jgi:Ca2+-binding RTX toxin-like protein
MLQEFTANYIRQFTQTGGISTTVSVATVTLIDNDLIRGNDADESVGIFNGTQQLVSGVGFVTINDGEALTTVFFNDGTALTGVEALYEVVTFKFFETTESFLLSTEALAAIGKTLADVARVQFDSFVDHSLNWSDFGFTPTGVVIPDPEPEPEPAPAPNVIRGTSRNDTLIGTSGSDAIYGGGDNDRLTGGAGADFFVFGADARDRDRDRDVITDFNAAEDTIVFELGVTIRFVEQVKNNLHIQLNGDRDLIVVQNADIGIVANFEFSDGLFLA